MKTTQLIIPILLVAIAGPMPLSAQCKDGNSNSTSSSHSESSSSSESMSRKVVIINGKTVVDETKHTKNGADVDRDADEPAADDEPWLGLRAEEASSALRAQLGLGEDEGLVVMDVAEDGPADKADLRVNDILLKFEDQPLGTPEDLLDALEGHQVGQTVKIEFLRRGEKSEAKVTLGNRNDAKGQEQLKEMKKRLREMMMNNGADGADIRIDGFDALLDNLDVEGGNRSFKLEVNGDNIQDLDEVLNNPNLPDEFKKTVRDMLSRMQAFDEKPAEN